MNHWICCLIAMDSILFPHNTLPSPLPCIPAQQRECCMRAGDSFPQRGVSPLIHFLSPYCCLNLLSRQCIGTHSMDTRGGELDCNSSSVRNAIAVGVVLLSLSSSYTLLPCDAAVCLQRLTNKMKQESRKRRKRKETWTPCVCISDPLPLVLSYYAPSSTRKSVTSEWSE